MQRTSLIPTLAIATLTMLCAAARAQTPGDIPVALRTGLHQEVEIHATPHQLYEALLSSKRFASFSAMDADITAKPGGPFKMFGGMIVGRNIELIPDKLIVQAWRPSHWKPGIYSIVRFELKANGSKTTVILDHTGFPAGDFDSLSDGWKLHYWEPLKKLFP